MLAMMVSAGDKTFYRFCHFFLPEWIFYNNLFEVRWVEKFIYEKIWKDGKSSLMLWIETEICIEANEMEIIKSGEKYLKKTKITSANI